MNRVKRRKRAATTCFLGIILSALVFVECTFLSYVWMLDYRMSVNLALKAETDVILSGYNRQLFDVYGIYAFTLDGVDDSVYYEVLEKNGYSKGDSIEVYGLMAFDTEQLKCAISMYYSYRYAAVSARMIAGALPGLLEAVDDIGIFEALGELTSSPAAGYIDDILSGGATIAGYVETALSVGSLLKSDYASEDTSLEDITEELGEAGNDLEAMDIGLGIENLSSLAEIANGYSDMRENMAGFISGVGSHSLCANYAAYNFDCSVEDDFTINGTSFEDIHDNNCFDVEYIFAGGDGRTGYLAAASMIFVCILAANIIEKYADKAFVAVCDTIAAAVSALLALVTDGLVAIDPQIITLVIVLVAACAASVSGLKEVLDGGRYAFVDIGEYGTVELGYRDFMCLFLNFVPEDTLLNRMTDVLTRDYGELYTGLEIGTSGTGGVSVSKEYVFYGDSVYA